jgi:transcription antitermination factor NusA-like protein
MKGSRVQAVVQELRGEKIDIVTWDNDPARFVCNAIQPAEVSRVIIDAATHTMQLIVNDDKLSLAIGKKGQNVRLASQLTGWRIDIHSESKVREMETRALLLQQQYHLRTVRHIGWRYARFWDLRPALHLHRIGADHGFDGHSAERELHPGAVPGALRTTVHFQR